MAKVTFDETVRRTVEVPHYSEEWFPTRLINWIADNFDNLKVYSEETRGMEFVGVADPARFAIKVLMDMDGNDSETIGIYDNETGSYILQRHGVELETVRNIVKELNYVN